MRLFKTKPYRWSSSSKDNINCVRRNFIFTFFCGGHDDEYACQRMMTIPRSFTSLLLAYSYLCQMTQKFYILIYSNDVATWPVTWHGTQPHLSNSTNSCIQLKMPPPSDLQLTLSTRPTPNVISSAPRLQAEILCVRKPKGLDYPSTNFFPR